MKKIILIMLGIMLLSITQKAIAEESVDKIYHFIFKSEKNISNSENEAIFENFRMKTDMLTEIVKDSKSGIEKASIKKDGDMFIVTYKTKLKPEYIVAEIQADKFSTPLTLVTYFVCDVAESKGKE